MKRKFIAAILMAVPLAWSGIVVAQDDDHGYITVRATQVKTGHGADYRKMLGKLAASRKAKGHSGVNVFQSIRGPVSTYYIVTTHDTMAEVGVPFDSGMSEEDWSQWLQEMATHIETSQLTTLETHPDLAILPAEDSTPNMVVLRSRVLKPGNNAAYHDIIEERLMPALKAGGSKGWNATTTGAPNASSPGRSTARGRKNASPPPTSSSAPRWRSSAIPRPTKARRGTRASGWQSWWGKTARC